MNLEKLLKERSIELKYADSDYGFPELSKKAIITNKSEFTRKLLEAKGFNKFHEINEASVKKAGILKKKINEAGVVGFGGGRAIDLAKKISFDLGIDLISIPTAPSHDGLISKNCSLENRGARKTYPAKYPSKLIIPVELWKNSGELKKAGICDILSNIVALQDIKLSETRGETFSETYKNYSKEAVKRVLGHLDEKELSKALILSGFAMEETSRYCSGSEHEVERLLERILGSAYLHGQLAGTGTIICAKVYSMYSDKLPDFEGNSCKFYDEIRSQMEKLKVYEYATRPLYDSSFKPEVLREVSKIRPERYTLWNAIDSIKVDWKHVIDKILKD